MKRILSSLLLVFTLSASAAPLRVYVRGGTVNRGEEVHAHTRFAKEWPALLTERGITATGGTELPTDEQLAATDVIVMYAQEGGTVPPGRWMALESYLKRGGGLVVLHTAAVSLQEDHWKSIVGGCWRAGKTKWKEGPMDLYYVENQKLGGGHPITKDASNFHLDDEIYYDMDLSPDIHVLATSYTPNVPQGRRQAEGSKAHIYDIQPQIWTYERTIEGGTAPYRSVVSLPGHLYKTFALPHYRAIVMRSIAWAGKRENLDEFCKPEELSSLTYPEGGPQKPADTLKQLEIHPDFNLTLCAAEPLINKPMNFDWAPDGSLWVAETPEYPNGRRGMRPDYRGKEWKDHGGIDPTPGRQERPAQDKISRLTDTDGDGVMDKKEVFYEGLDLVTGLVFHKDGVIVTQAPDILWLRDTDKDGKADKVEKLYGNLGTGDTHAVINNPRWGWDGWIYATHGYSASDRVMNVKGEKQPNIGSGVVRFKPDGSAIEQYSSKGGNTWGLQITGDNRVMWTQPTSGTILEHTVLPEYALARGKWGNTPSFNVVIGSPKSYPAMAWEQLAYVQIDLVGSFTATAGCVIYDGGSWPEEYNGDYFTTEPTINIVHHQRLTPKGSSYTGTKLPGREETEFIRSRDMWWRPIEVRVGPDGAVYIGDFYNQAVIHNDTRGPDHNQVNAAVRPDRDHYFGRIWRLDHKQAKKLAVPDLSKADAAALVKALEHPNRHVRMNASRLLVEKKNPSEKEALTSLAGNQSASADAKIAALWTAQGIVEEDKLFGLRQLLSRNEHPAVRRNASLASENAVILIAATVDLILDPEASVRVAALRGIATTGDVSAEVAAAVVAAWPKFDDDFQKSGAVGALARNSAAAIAAILDSGNADLAQLASILTQSIGEKNDSAAAAKLVIALSDKPASADGLKRGILDTLSKSLKAAPDMSAELTAALTKLLTSGAAGSALPIAAQWDKAGTLKPAMAQLTKDLFAKLQLQGATDEDRFTAAQSLIGLRSANAEALPAVLGVVAGDSSPALKTRLINALGETGDAAVGPALAAGFAKLPAEAQTVAFNAVVKRADWSIAFLDAIKAKTVDVAVLGPANVFRLRSHPDKEVSQRANAMLDTLMPGMKEKAEMIAKLLPEVEKKPNLEMGKTMFTVQCATCHKFGNAGAEVGPNLTGMGAHGAGELLAAIVDPNAEVDPSFTAWNIETKDGQAFAGVIARENPTSLFLKFQGGEKEIKTADIKTRINTGRSLMPDVLGQLGPEMMRDIIGYMQATDGGKYRTLDLRNAFTASTSLGLYNKQEITGDSFRFRKTGTVPVDGVPFNVVAPNRSPQNVIVLKGGPPGSFSKSLPKNVDIKVGGLKVSKIHFLGGVAGWGYPYGRDTNDLMVVTVHTTQGQRESIMTKNGVEFADYIGNAEVPGSKPVRGLVERPQQVRWFTKTLHTPAELDRITLSSTDGGAAPTIFAVTVELDDGTGVQTPAPAPEGKKTGRIEVKVFEDGKISVGGKETALAALGERLQEEVKAGHDKEVLLKSEPQVPAPKIYEIMRKLSDEGFTKAAFTLSTLEWKVGTRVLLIGGGASHDYQKWFNEYDRKLLTEAGYSVNYTEDAKVAASELANVDVAVLSANHGSFGGVPFREALNKFIEAKKGLVLLHPGLWYNWADWPDYNKTIAGGGSRGHDRLGEFEVKVSQPEHPLVKGVVANFKITDELYYYKPDPEGTPIEVLASATSTQRPGDYPQVFVVKHPQTKIAGLTLGHDGRAHELEQYKTLLLNAVKWTSGK
jgi:putative membrane-bound dehydrogenase-like protein